MARALFGIGEDAVAIIDGQRAEEHQVLGEGQLLEFVKHSGQKGAPTGLRNAYFDVGGSYFTLLPGNLRGPQLGWG